MWTARFLALLAVFALVAAACGDKTEEGGEGHDGGTIQIEGQDANDHGSKDVSGMDEIEMELDDFYFSPTVLEGEAGQTITLQAFNEGGETHTFTIEDGDVDETLDPEVNKDIEVTFPDSGVLAFECRFHEGQGMRGALSIGPIEAS
ncbi:MAG: cupredoxin domain-containing protein [Actinobacteria bacterium]|nr:cupredoxin domain-containing protein [Actinomycetota bacterium]